jgi:hypothetical protein
MTKSDQQQTSRTEPDEIAALIAASPPGIEVALQQFEGAERVYYDAVIATTLPESVIASATTPYSVDAG